MFFYSVDDVSGEPPIVPIFYYNSGIVSHDGSESFFSSNGTADRVLLPKYKIGSILTFILDLNNDDDDGGTLSVSINYDNDDVDDNESNQFYKLFDHLLTNQNHQGCFIPVAGVSNRAGITFLGYLDS